MATATPLSGLSKPTSVLSPMFFVSLNFRNKPSAKPTFWPEVAAEASFQNVNPLFG